MANIVNGVLARLLGCAVIPIAIVGSAWGRPYTVDDIVRSEAFGRIVVAPGGRWLLFERRAGMDQVAYFDERSMEVLRSRLYRVDLLHPGLATPVLPVGEDTGTILLGFSPAGTRAAIARLHDRRWTLGVVTLASGTVHWFDISPDYYPYRTTIGWGSETLMLVIAQPGGQLPYVLRANRQDIDRLEHAWAAQRAGIVPTVTSVGSGNHLAMTPLPTQTNLLALDTLTGTEHMLATGALQSIAVAPDGRHVALVTEVEAIRVRPTLPISTGAELRRRRLRVIEIANGRTWEPCPLCDLQYRAPVWSPSGHELLFFARRENEAWQDGRVWRADAPAEICTPLKGDIHPAVQTPPGEYASASFGWFGASPIVFGRVANAVRDDWYRQNGAGAQALTAMLSPPPPDLIGDPGGPKILSGKKAWRLGYPVTTPVLADMTHILRQTTAVSGSAMVENGVFGWKVDGKGIVADPGTGDVVRIGIGDGIRPVTASTRRNAIVALATDGHGRRALVIYRRSHAPLAVAHINAHLADIDDPPPMPLHHALPDGRLVTSWLYLPRGTGRTQTLPLVVIPYATAIFGVEPPRGQSTSDGAPFTNIAVLRDHGYAVLLPSMPALPASDAGPDLAGQVLAAVDAAVATGVIDKNRLGMWGHSFGGYTVAMIAAQTDRFRAAVASNGLYDLAAYLGTFTPQTRVDPSDYQSVLTWYGWGETGQPRLGGPPWLVPGRYVGSSPIYRADRIHTPMLIVAGERDFAPLQQSEELFSALYRQGKDAVLLSYWGEEHNMASPANLRDSYRRILEWLDTHLGTVSR